MKTLAEMAIKTARMKHCVAAFPVPPSRGHIEEIIAGWFPDLTPEEAEQIADAVEPLEGGA